MADSPTRTALITGASGGIGLDLARLFAADGHNLVLIARGVEKLNALAEEVERRHGVQTLVIPADLAHPNAPGSICRVLEEQKIAVDFLANNAGFGLFGAFVELDRDEQLRMIQLNVTALTDLTHRLLPGMKSRGFGRILNVASTAAFQPGPLMAVYYASKAYVLSFSEALANELKGSGVTVTCLCPGPTESGFQARAAMGESKLVRGKVMMTSAEVAQQGYDALMKGRTTFIPGMKNKLLAFSVRFTPRSLLPGIVRKMQEADAGG